MDYNHLKAIFSEKVFYKLQNLINRPTLKIYIKDYTSAEDAVTNPSDPFDNEMVVIGNVTGDMYFVKEVNCIYAYSKNMVGKDESQLGMVNTLTVFMRYDDIPSIVFERLASVIVVFNNIQYIDVDIQNLYNIIVQASIKL